MDPAEQAAASEHLLDAVERKRAGQRLGGPDIERLIGDFTAGRTPDYQMAAWLATVACVGMDLDETAALTRAYVGGAAALSRRGQGRRVVDKHSTGGVGDKVTLVVAPLAAACGVNVAKMSGRGLGWAGGTIDKLESIPGLRLDLSAAEAREVLARTGLVLTGQSPDLAPGDGATYGLRDVTATVDSVPLIAASIISKKVAVGADGLVLDVKTGLGALMPDPAAAAELAELMVDLAGRFGIPARAIISDMNQPLGYAVGNALEVKEAVSVLRGREVPGLSALSRVIARLMLQVVEPGLSDDHADQRVAAALASGAAYRAFVGWACAQGADPELAGDIERLPTAACRDLVRARRSGWVETIDPRVIGQAALRAGAGRLLQDAPLDPAAGVLLRCQVGSWVTAGEVLAEIHHSGSGGRALELADTAFGVGSDRPVPTPVVHRIISPAYEAQS